MRKARPKANITASSNTAVYSLLLSTKRRATQAA